MAGRHIPATINPSHLSHDLEQQAKAIVALAFRNGPLEDVHAGSICTACQADPAVSHITQAEVKAIMKHAVNWVYTLLRLREENPAAYERAVRQGLMYTPQWDAPEFPPELLHFIDRARSSE